MKAERLSTKTSLSQHAYASIQQRIVSGDLKIGSLVSEQSLAEDLGISRTPVREAIRQLQHEGLVEQIARYGTIVRMPNRRELEESYEVRQALESFAVAQASQCADRADIAKARVFLNEMVKVAAHLEDAQLDSLEGVKLQRFLAADLGFHMSLLQAAGNSQILRLVNSSRVMTRIFGTARVQHDLKIVRPTCEQHRAILEAVEERDAMAAGRLMAEHIQAGKRITLSSFDRLQAQGTNASLGLPTVMLDEISKISPTSRRERI